MSIIYRYQITTSTITITIITNKTTTNIITNTIYDIFVYQTKSCSIIKYHHFSNDFMSINNTNYNKNYINKLVTNNNKLGTYP